jgi:DNA-nicking Smr family endonuclease
MANLKNFADLKSLSAQLKAESEKKREKPYVKKKCVRQLQKLTFSELPGRRYPGTYSATSRTGNSTPCPLPFQHIADEQAALMESLSDEFDAESLLETDEALSYARPGVGPDVVRKLRKGNWVIQAQLDLHGMRRDQARESLGEFLRKCCKNGTRCVRIIHGKGNGSMNKEPVLKHKVRTWLVQKEEVLAFSQATAADGGSGALIVLLQS